jgi:hypothetical protein
LKENYDWKLVWFFFYGEASYQKSMVWVEKPPWVFYDLLKKKIVRGLTEICQN